MTAARSRETRIRRATLAVLGVAVLAGGCAGTDDDDLAACHDGVATPSNGPTAERHLIFEDPWPITEEILAAHDMRFDVRDADGRPVVDVYLDGIRDLALPDPSVERVRFLDREQGTVLQDPRSKINDLWRVDEATVLAADVAYEVHDDVGNNVRSIGSVDEKFVDSIPGYFVVEVWVDTFAGFAAVVFEAADAAVDGPHRIYAVAGTHVFYRTDFRSWATGLTLSRFQFVSGAAMLMVQDAAAYAQDIRYGGEVIITGQSQGALAAQGIGFMLQTFLDSMIQPQHLVHVVSWGGAGAEEAIVRMIEAHLEDGDRGFSPDLERHWSHMEETYPTLLEIWGQLNPEWDAIPPGAIQDHVRSVGDRMRIVGYFFEIDLFARAGTFTGTTMVFPTVLVLPDECEQLVSERELGLTGGTFGASLESHFLNGYSRAVSRGAIGLSRPAEPTKWDWVIDLLPITDEIGDDWLTNLYLGKLGESDINWQRCLRAEEWMTSRNDWCEETHWPGCGQSAGGHWCLIKEGARAADPPLRP